LPKADGARRFHFLREIASGGFGSVYLAKLMHADGFSRLAAVKLLHRRWSENEEIAQRMRDEARLLGWLRHRNIVDVVDLTSIDGRAAIIMEYLEAVDLKIIVHELTALGQRMPVRAALESCGFVASALDAAYNRPPVAGEKPLRVIHRDIKPSNIMVDDAGLVKVLDFGVARAEFDARESHTRDLQFGSVDYMPPERLFFEPETPASDVYSLGSTLYELLTLEKLGKARGRPERHAALIADRMSYLRALLALPGPLANELDDLLAHCLAYEQERRPTSAEVTTRTRALARAIGGPTVAEWAEVNVPPTLQKVREIPRRPNPLTDTILSEDSLSFTREEAETLDQDSALPPLEVRPDATLVSDDDPRWAALRAAAVAEIESEVTPFGTSAPVQADLPPDPSIFGPPSEPALTPVEEDPEPTLPPEPPVAEPPFAAPPPGPSHDPYDAETPGATDAISAPYLRSELASGPFTATPKSSPPVELDPLPPPTPPAPAPPPVPSPVETEPVKLGGGGFDDDWDDLPTRIATREDQKEIVSRVREREDKLDAFLPPPELREEVPDQVVRVETEDAPTVPSPDGGLLDQETRILSDSDWAEDSLAGQSLLEDPQADGSASVRPAEAPDLAENLGFDDEQPTQLLPEGDGDPTRILAPVDEELLDDHGAVGVDATQILPEGGEGLLDDESGTAPTIEPGHPPSPNTWPPYDDQVRDDVSPTERGPRSKLSSMTLIPDSFGAPLPPPPGPAAPPPEPAAPPAPPKVEAFFDDPGDTEPPAAVGAPPPVPAPPEPYQAPAPPRRWTTGDRTPTTTSPSPARVAPRASRCWPGSLSPS